MSSENNNKKSQWAKFAERVHKESLLSGAGDFVLQQSKELREDFAFKHDYDLDESARSEALKALLNFKPLKGTNPKSTVEILREIRENE